jgi:hypothetical protein
MGVPPSSMNERRAALIKLQRLLSHAEASLSTGGANVDPVFQDLSDAFEQFRNRYHDQADTPAPGTPGAEARRIAVRRLAAAVADMDESVTRRDSPGLKAALDGAREALDTYQRIDQSSSSGLRLRLPADLDDEVPAKKRGKR